MDQAAGEVLASIGKAAGVVALVFGLAYWSASRVVTIPASRRVMWQAVGAALTFWAVYAKVGWQIQTIDGNSPAETFNEWFFYIVTAVGTLLLAYATFLRGETGGKQPEP